MPAMEINLQRKKNQEKTKKATRYKQNAMVYEQRQSSI